LETSDYVMKKAFEKSGGGEEKGGGHEPKGLFGAS